MKLILFFCLFIISCDNSIENNSMQVCLSISGLDLNYSVTEDISGFQINHNGCITSAINGDASSNDFTILLSETTLLAFSLNGSTIPSGMGTLIELNSEVSQNCINELIFSGIGGTSLTVDWTCEVD